ncbi:hypothetical protein CTI12_AA411610 [Artemisia annua]|uniref:Uncharacterized protein n=1 Tax=Artemisia annua TaxID=35608 RepID=A0A2U1M6V8_ARTAN|nr:hypothetical protein CTI12_AA411610 [Artemisia annua]
MNKVVDDDLGNGLSGNVSLDKGRGTLDKGKGSLDKGNGCVDKGKGNVDKGKSIMVDEGKIGQTRKSARKRNVGIVINHNVNPYQNDFNDSDSDIDLEEMFEDVHEYDSDSEYSDKSLDYLSEGEDELISLRKRNTEAKHNPTLTKPNRNTREPGYPRPSRV